MTEKRTMGAVWVWLSEAKTLNPWHVVNSNAAQIAECQKEENAAFIAEAFNVAHETGQSPRQLWGNTCASNSSHIEAIAQRDMAASNLIIANRERDQLAKDNARLREALIVATGYVEKTHGTLVGAVGHNNVVLPDLEKCKAALTGKERQK